MGHARVRVNSRERRKLKSAKAVAPWLKWLRRLVVAGCLTTAAALLWWTKACTEWPETFIGSGPSMEPTVRPGEIFVVTSPVGELSRGTLVIFRFVHEDSVYLVLRRVAALPGDTLAMENGRAVVNGRPMDWPYRVLEPRAAHSPLAKVDDLYTWGPWVAPRDSVLLLSDTRDVVGWPDSRFIGPVAIADLTAVAGHRLWSSRPGRLLRRLR